MSYLQDPRVYFAAERTMLAWLRTGLSLAALGMAIAKYQYFIHTLAGESLESARSHLSHWIGLGIVCCALLFSLVAWWQFRAFVGTLEEVELPPRYSQWAIQLMALLAQLIIGILLAYLLIN